MRFRGNAPFVYLAQPTGLGTRDLKLSKGQRPGSLHSGGHLHQQTVGLSALSFNSTIHPGRWPGPDKRLGPWPEFFHSDRLTNEHINLLKNPTSLHAP